MSDPKHIDLILRQWPYEPETVNVRLIQGEDDRELLQMRIDLGLLQLEMTGRPDGEKPGGYDTYLANMSALALDAEEPFKLNEEQCDEVDREFIQFYHRRICWLKLQRYDDAVRDANHTLALMDFCIDHAPDEQWMMSHEQYRPFVLFHRVQASALHALEHQDADAAISQINEGLTELQTLFEEHDMEEFFEENELVTRLTDFRESLRDEYQVGKTLGEQLDEAVASEQYERAAQLRDEISKRGQH